MKNLRWMALVLISIAGLAAAEEAVKPQCTAKIRGRFWPEEANTDQSVTRKAIKCGELQICTVRGIRHRWEYMTIHVSQLRSADPQPVSACVASEAAPTDGKSSTDVAETK